MRFEYTIIKWQKLKSLILPRAGENEVGNIVSNKIECVHIWWYSDSTSKNMHQSYSWTMFSLNIRNIQNIFINCIFTYQHA